MRKQALILFLIFVVSCAPNSQVNPTSAVTLSPSATATKIGTTTPSPTSTKSRVDEIFTLPTYGPYIQVTLTPLVTPEPVQPILAHTNVTEDELIDLIEELQNSSYQNFPPHTDWWSEGMFLGSQVSVALLIEEFLFRFPDSIYAERLRWQLAFIDLIHNNVGGNIYDDQWIVSQLEEKLDAGECLPTDLDSFLDQYWFETTYTQPIENLFGDGKTAWLHVISPQAWLEEEINDKSQGYFGYGGLFIVVREIVDGDFQVLLLENAVSFTSGDSYIYEISDHNRNDLPEIALNVGYHSGNICWGNLKIFEWSDDSFQELTGEDIELGDCLDEYEYIILNGVPAIRLQRLFTSNPFLYKWNGNSYEFSDFEYETPERKWTAAIQAPKDRYKKEIEAIEEILSSSELGGLDSAQIDFLRFRLGMAYAFISNPQQARKVFQKLVDNPSSITGPTYQRIAQNFLNFYTGDTNLYRACHESQKLIDSITKTLSSEDKTKKFGFDDNFISFSLRRLSCYEDDVFEYLVEKMPNNLDNLSAELKNNGIKTYYVEKQDVNLDGKVEEWLVIFDGGIYVVFPKSTNLNALDLGYFIYDEDMSKFANAQVSVEKWNETQPAVLKIHAGQEIFIVSVSKDFTTITLLSEIHVEKVVFSSKDSPPQFQIYYIKPGAEFSPVSSPWIGFRWDDVRQAFRQDLIEYYLFVEKNPEKATQMCDNLTPLLLSWMADGFEDTWGFPEKYYVCGLAYELAGEIQKSAEIYLQLWRSFPTNEFAFLAKSKLEPITP